MNTFSHVQDTGFSRLKSSSLKQDIQTALVLGILGTIAAYFSINIPHTEVFIEIRWAFGYLGFVLIRRIGVVLILASILCLVGFHRVSLDIVYFGNMLYAIPFGFFLRFLHERFLAGIRKPGWYAFCWFLLILAGYQLFTGPATWFVLGIIRSALTPDFFIKGIFQESVNLI